tara:strand:- start:6806 stop:7636 length:831 start_codon:yes stop_codon:yes gene_type:complete
MPVNQTPVEPSTIENIDTGIYEWVRDLELSTVTNDGFKQTPVIWLGTERAFQIKNNKELRDSVGKLKLPLITLNRDSIAKDPAFKGSFQAHMFENPDFKGGTITIKRRIKQDKTRNFANADSSRSLKGNETRRGDNNKIVYEFLTIPIPVYVTMMYTIVLRSEYQQQMNELLTPFITKTGQINTFIFEKNGWSYEAFIQQEFAENKNVDNLSEEERRFETKIQVKVLGYLIGEGINRVKPKYSIRENRTEIRISRERVIVGDKRPWLNNDDFDFKE